MKTLSLDLRVGALSDGRIVRILDLDAWAHESLKVVAPLHEAVNQALRLFEPGTIDAEDVAWIAEILRAAWRWVEDL